ncbi:MAG: sugar transferase [Bdellovibrionota bacterium]
MLKENWRVISRTERVGDFLIIIMSFFAAYYGRDSLLYWDQRFQWGLPFSGDLLAPLKDYFIVLFVGLLSYMATLQVFGAYSSMRLSSSFRLLRIGIVSSVITFFTLAAVLYILKIDLSRSFIVLFCVIVGLSLTAERFLVLEFLRYFRRRGWNFRNIIICGIGDQALRLAAFIVARPELGVRIRGFADLKEPKLDKSSELVEFKKNLGNLGMRSGRILSGVNQVKQALEEYAIDELICTDVIDVMPEVEEMILTCTEQGVQTTIAADLFSVGLIKSGISYFGDMPLIHFQTPPGDRWELGIKRLIDLIISGILLIILSPVFLLIMLGIKLSAKGPIFFRQTRVGLNGRLFTMYKFRSMYQDAEEKLEELKAQNEMQGPAFKMKNDPRVTAIGKWLRKYSLDEMPQFWNVFIGDMSLVGPRPPVPGEVNLYQRKYRRRLSMRPGLTCTWQVTGRNKISDFDYWVELDLDYIDNWSLTRDFLLLVRTIPVVLRGQGAH